MIIFIFSFYLFFHLNFSYRFSFCCCFFLQCTYLAFLFLKICPYSLKNIPILIKLNENNNNNNSLHLYSAFLLFLSTQSALHCEGGGCLLVHHQCAASTWMRNSALAIGVLLYYISVNIYFISSKNFFFFYGFSFSFH